MLPSPNIGINDVLIRVLRTGICGTDVHIYKWDEWAQKTIPVPMAIGHEFVGEIVDVGSNVTDFHPRRPRQRRRPRGLRPLPQLPRRPPPSLRLHHGRRSQSPRRLCRIHRAAHDQHLAPPRGVAWTSPPSSIPSATPCTLRSPFPSSAKTCSSPARAPSASWPSAVVQHAGARYIVVTDLNPYRLELARKMGVTVAVNARETTSPTCRSNSA